MHDDAYLDEEPGSRRTAERLLDIVRDYESVNVSEKILRIILSYTGFINQRVWHCE